jgi:aspartyl-tRNA(Asn)/glutamyl-tRNA(Gln) amidotransferase subunit A
VSALTDLGVVEAATLLAQRELTATELTTACLDRIESTDGAHSHDGDPHSINAWVRVYAGDALDAAKRADELLAAGGERPPLLGVPVGLKDLYEVAGKPVTASSRVLHDVPSHDCDVWQRLRAAGMILLGHLHTHEFAVGGTTDQVGNPHDLTRTAGGSSGGSAAALAARMVPAATGTDTAGSLRIPSACCGTASIKPTRGLVSTRGVVPLSWTLDHAGPMARSLDDCRALLAAMVGPDAGRAESSLHRPVDRTAGSGATLAGSRIALSPRVASVQLDPDVAAGYERMIEACRSLGATIVEPPTPTVGFTVDEPFVDVMTADMLGYHRRFDGQRELYRRSVREWVEIGEQRAISGARYAAIQSERRHVTAVWTAWLDEHRITAVLEPTLPIVAPLRGDGYDTAGSDVVLISLTYFWDWTGYPVVTFPAGAGSATGLPVSASLIGRAGQDWELLAMGGELEDEFRA